MTLCTVNDENNAITKMLEGLGFKQVMKEATHIEGRHIDHCYWNDKSKKWEVPEIERYSPYHSDHDAILVTLKKRQEENT